MALAGGRRRLDPAHLDSGRRLRSSTLVSALRCGDDGQSCARRVRRPVPTRRYAGGGGDLRRSLRLFPRRVAALCHRSAHPDVRQRLGSTARDGAPAFGMGRAHGMVAVPTSPPGRSRARYGAGCGAAVVAGQRLPGHAGADGHGRRTDGALSRRGVVGRGRRPDGDPGPGGDRELPVAEPSGVGADRAGRRIVRADRVVDVATTDACDRSRRAPASPPADASQSGRRRGCHGDHVASASRPTTRRRPGKSPGAGVERRCRPSRHRLVAHGDSQRDLGGRPATVLVSRHPRCSLIPPRPDRPEVGRRTGCVRCGGRRRGRRCDRGPGSRRALATRSHRVLVAGRERCRARARRRVDVLRAEPLRASDGLPPFAVADRDVRLVRVADQCGTCGRPPRPMVAGRARRRGPRVVHRVEPSRRRRQRGRTPAEGHRADERAGARTGARGGNGGVVGRRRLRDSRTARVVGAGPAKRRRCLLRAACAGRGTRSASNLSGRSRPEGHRRRVGATGPALLP